MAQYLIVKRKNNVVSIEAFKVNYKRALTIINHSKDKFATYYVAKIEKQLFEIKDENREMLQENAN